MSGEIATSAQLLVDAVMRGDDPDTARYPVEDLPGATVRLRAEGDDVRASLHVEALIEGAGRYTDNMLGYPATLGDFPRAELGAISGLVGDEVSDAFDCDIDLRLAYDGEASTAGETAVYRATLDIWFEEEGDGIDSVWIRARPTGED